MATRVTITKALEAKIRNPEGMDEIRELLDELRNRLDDEQGKRAAAASGEPKDGLSYRELVALFRSYLGESLLTPPKPNTAYIVRIINKAREQGIDSTNVEQAIAGFRRAGAVPRLAELVYNYDKWYQLGADAGGKDAGNAENNDGAKEAVRRLYTGRDDVSDND